MFWGGWGPPPILVCLGGGPALRKSTGPCESSLAPVSKVSWICSVEVIFPLGIILFRHNEFSVTLWTSWTGFGLLYNSAPGIALNLLIIPAQFMTKLHTWTFLGMASTEIGGIWGILLSLIVMLEGSPWRQSLRSLRWTGHQAENSQTWVWAALSYLFKTLIFCQASVESFVCVFHSHNGSRNSW